MVFLQGVITGSVNLDEADISINKEARTVTIKFRPGAVITSNPQIGPDGIKIVVVSDPNIFHKISDTDRTNGISDAIKELKQAAKKDNIEEKTAKGAKLMLAGFIEALGYQSEISFEGMNI